MPAHCGRDEDGLQESQQSDCLKVAIGLGLTHCVGHKEKGTQKLYA